MLLSLTIVAVVIVGYGLIVGAERRRDRLLDKRLTYLEEKTNALYLKHGIPLPEHDAVRTLVLRRRRVEAAELYRVLTQAEPKEAMEFVNRLAKS
ncbi:hypothetical protein M8C13_07045 [Crossiella sp. SN42]|uniref:hypothetical protein n=1 Tax=Crossiella sp. SN42 TaxID=2944808 RepID=UPI00207D2BD1|nr:hypothetical protein [Crossiella sp. SN42]MCO1575513.1 hypothetical protein [Crossiella sp. SN42]